MRAVFLDRDGVLNRAIVREGRPYPPASLAEFEILEEAREACQLLREAGFILICVTNQPDLARGSADPDFVSGVNEHLRHMLQLSDIRVCAHDDKDNCDCRKPKPGLIMAAARDFKIDLFGSFLIGDRWRDIEAGIAAGCASIFINRGYAEKRPLGQDYETHCVRDAAEWILRKAKTENLEHN